MFTDTSPYLYTLEQIIDATRVHISDISPSQFYMQNMVFPKGSAFPGPASYNLTPYLQEIVDCAHKNHPARQVSFMKGAQVGGTAMVLNPIIAYTIACNPGNTMFLTGHSDLTLASMNKIDLMIDACNIRHLIKPSALRKKNQRTGDTNFNKEFAGGYLKSGSVTNHNLLRQHDIMVMIVDDYDAAAGSSKEAGSTRLLVQKRTAAFATKRKIFWVSSPQLKGNSNIEEVFLLGDQRYYNVPCPLCGTMIVLHFTIETPSGDTAGIHYKVDSTGRVIRSSVGYVCQHCAGFFTDKSKYEMNLAGQWVPTVEPKEDAHYSYQLSSLYSPPGMDDWAFYCSQYVNATAENNTRRESEMQAFYNLCLGQTYEQKGEAPKASTIQRNGGYPIGIIPESLSLEHGNGHIVLLTLACDLNGTEDDARIDWQIVAHAETGATYSIDHGSIGTFVPRETNLRIIKDRQHYTYSFNSQYSVWPLLHDIIIRKYPIDSTRDGRKPMSIFIAGVDCGYLGKQFAYPFIEGSIARGLNVVGLKGDGVGLFRKVEGDYQTFKPAKEKNYLYLLESNLLKDQVAKTMELRWDRAQYEYQPPGYMNFPTPADGKYVYENFFSHFEAEERVTETKGDHAGSYSWKKKNSAVQNHQFDCWYYNIGLRDIATHTICHEMGIKKANWQDYVEIIMKLI
jgi:phage terminase large subunit GpA-like protein